MKLSQYLTKARHLWNTPGNRGHRLRWLVRSVGWYFHKRISQSPWQVTIFGGMRFACYPASLMAEHLMYKSEYFDYNEMKFIEAFLQPGDTFLDVGSNVGLYSLLAASRVGDGRIFSVEPHPSNLVFLRENVETNLLKQVRVLPMVAGEKEGEVVLSDADVFAGVATDDRAATDGALRVPMGRLDDVLEGLMPAVTKVDVEGYEWGVFRGLSEAMAAGRLPIALFELIGHMERYRQSENAFCEWWREQGYELATYDHETTTFTVAKRPNGDVFALSSKGMEMVRERMPQVRFVKA